jgi:hypothetical protein
MQYKKGMRVKNPYALDWGVGEVLDDTAGNTVSVFFVDAGQKTLSLTDLELVKVDGEEANHPILDNLKIVVDEGLRFRSLPESIQRFLKEYPGGFYGERFAGNERDYKVNAHRLMRELLNKDGFKALTSQGGLRRNMSPRPKSREQHKPNFSQRKDGLKRWAEFV